MAKLAPSDLAQVLSRLPAQSNENVIVGFDKADDAGIQRRVARSVIEKSLSVRETERAVKTAAGRRTLTVARQKVSEHKDPNYAAAETKLRRRLGTNVSIVPNANGAGGRLEIEYYNQEDLDRIYQTIIE